MCSSWSAWPSSTAASGRASSVAPPRYDDKMFSQFFFELRRADVPVSLREYLDLMGALDRGLGHYQVEEFYYLSRALLVKGLIYKEAGETFVALAISTIVSISPCVA